MHRAALPRSSLARAGHLGGVCSVFVATHTALLRARAGLQFPPSILGAVRVPSLSSVSLLTTISSPSTLRLQGGQCRDGALRREQDAGLHPGPPQGPRVEQVRTREGGREGVHKPWGRVARPPKVVPNGIALAPKREQNKKCVHAYSG
jgi:hypothetical protein